MKSVKARKLHLQDYITQNFWNLLTKKLGWDFENRLGWNQDFRQRNTVVTVPYACINLNMQAFVCYKYSNHDFKPCHEGHMQQVNRNLYVRSLTLKVVFRDEFKIILGTVHRWSVSHESCGMTKLRAPIKIANRKFLWARDFHNFTKFLIQFPLAI